MAEIELNRAAARNGDLPNVCVYCGAPAALRRRRVFTGTTPITMTVGRGIMQAKLPVCEVHRRHTLVRRLTLVAIALPWMVVVLLLSQLDSKGGGPEWLAGLRPYRGILVLLMLAGFAVLIIGRFVSFYTDVRLVGASLSTLWLTGVSDAFARACRGEASASDRGDGEVLDVLEVLPDEAGVRRPGRQIDSRGRKSGRSVVGPVLIGLLVVGVLGLILCAGGFIFPLKWASSALPVTLSNARVTSALGIGTHIQVDYHCPAPLSADRQYFLVVEQDGRHIAQRSFSASELRDRGTLDMDVLGNLRAKSSPKSVFIEEASSANADRKRISNSMIVR